MTEPSGVANQNFVPIKEAVRKVPYSLDYVGRLAREGKVESKRVGRQWLVELDSLKLFSLEQEALKRRRQEALSEERRHEKILAQTPRQNTIALVAEPALAYSASAKALAVTCCLFFILGVAQVAVQQNIKITDMTAGVGYIDASLQEAFAYEAFTNWLAHFFTQPQSMLVVQPTDIVGNAVTTEDVSRESRTAKIVSLDDTVSIVAPDMEVASLFSDDIHVTFFDSRMGTITPVFRNTNDNDYLFVVVPERNSVKP